MCPKSCILLLGLPFSICLHPPWSAITRTKFGMWVVITALTKTEQYNLTTARYSLCPFIQDYLHSFVSPWHWQVMILWPFKTLSEVCALEGKNKALWKQNIRTASTLWVLFCYLSCPSILLSQIFEGSRICPWKYIKLLFELMSGSLITFTWNILILEIAPWVVFCYFHHEHLNTTYLFLQFQVRKDMNVKPSPYAFFGFLLLCDAFLIHS